MSALDQTITGYETWHLALPVTSTRDHGIGRVAGTCEIVVLALTAEDGTTGWGEASPWAVFTGSPEASRVALERYIRPHVVGRRLSDRAAILADAATSVAHCTEAKAALETALLDLTGRVLSVPVHALLGGAHVPTRNTPRKTTRVPLHPVSASETGTEFAANSVRIPLSVSLADPDFARDRDLLARLREDGVRIVKLKTGTQDHAFDITRLEALAQDFPEFRVRIDYNQGLSHDEALARVRDAATFGPDFIEQPVRAHLWDLMAEIRQAIDVPLLADESVFGPEDMTRAIGAGLCDGVSVKIMKSGGPTRAQTVARMAAASGLAAYGGDMFEAGLAHLAGMHMIAATPEITLGCEFYQAKYYLAEDILETPIRYGGGHVVLPGGPGLGIAPDRDKLERYALTN